MILKEDKTMANGDCGYFGKGDTGYAQYMTAFNRNFGSSSGGGGNRPCQEHRTVQRTAAARRSAGRSKAAGVRVLYLLCHIGRDSLEIVERGKAEGGSGTAHQRERPECGNAYHAKKHGYTEIGTGPTAFDGIEGVQLVLLENIWENENKNANQTHLGQLFWVGHDYERPVLRVDTAWPAHVLCHPPGHWQLGCDRSPDVHPVL